MPRRVDVLLAAGVERVPDLAGHGLRVAHALPGVLQGLLVAAEEDLQDAGEGPGPAADVTDVALHPGDVVELAVGDLAGSDQAVGVDLEMNHRVSPMLMCRGGV